MRITAKTFRDGSWWGITVPQVPGAVSQAKRLDQVEAAARGAVADLLMVDPAAITIELEIEIPADERQSIEKAKLHLGEAEAAVKRAAELNSETIKQLRTNGYTTREVAILMGLTPGRVNQIEHKHAA